MTATRDDIKGWLSEGKELGAAHVLIAVDRFDHDNYPIFVMPGQDAHKRYEEIVKETQNTMQAVDEVYNLTKPLSPQLAKHRAMEF